MNKKFNQNLILILGIFILLIAGVLIYRSFFFKKILTQREIEKSPEIPTPPEIPPPQPPPKTPIATKTKEPEETPYFDIDLYFSTSSDIKVEGVEIVYKKNSKLIINYKEKYQIEVPNNLILNRSWTSDALEFDNLDLIKTGSPSKYWPVMFIWVWTKEKFAGLYDSNYNLIQNQSMPRVIINNIEFVKVFREGVDPKNENSAYSYLTMKNGKIYEIYIISRELYEKYVKTFKFLR